MPVASTNLIKLSAAALLAPVGLKPGLTSDQGFYLGTSSVVVAFDFARPRSRANLIDAGVWYFSR